MANQQSARQALCASWTTAAILDDYMSIPQRLLRFGGRDLARSKLVQSRLCGEQLADDVGHRSIMLDAWDVSAGRLDNPF